SFPIIWMIGNSRMHGNAQYPAVFINALHRTWFAEGEALWGVGPHRALNLLFWPLVAAATLTPSVFLGLREARGFLLAVMLLPVLVFTTRSTVVGDFEPFARFTAGSLLILMAFAGAVLRPLAVVGVAVFTLALGGFTWHREGKLPDALRPLSPVTTLPAIVMEAAAQ